MHDKRILAAGIVIVLVIAGAAIVLLGGRVGPESPQGVSQGQSTATGPVPEELLQPTETGLALDQAPAEPAQILPTPRSGLEASDPDSVELASGSLQLVEAFAFW